MQEKLSYEQAMNRLEEIARQMDENKIGIDEMAERLKEAKQLIGDCRKRLYEVDGEIQEILKKE